MGSDPSGDCITCTLKLKLDVSTMFEWQCYSQSSTEFPHYKHLLEFVDLCAQASESATSENTRKSFRLDSSSSKKNSSVKPVASFVASADTIMSHCVICKSERYPL